MYVVVSKILKIKIIINRFWKVGMWIIMCFFFWVWGVDIEIIL